MDLLAFSTPLLVVNLIFAALALAIGFAAGAWVCGGERAEEEQKDTPTPPQQTPDSQLELERTMLASDRLRDLATSVASDVGAHSKSIVAIETDLAGAQAAGGAAAADAVADALARISEANEQLQSKLEKAEQQIQAQAEQIKTHESEARTDSLTGLANRRAFDDELSRRFSEWGRKGTEFALLILDVDHFKKFNDTHGHQAGDEVLRKVGDALADCARDMDLPCRYGGEEFAVVLPATVGLDGCPLAERVRKSVEDLRIAFEGKTLNVTVSLGLAGVLPSDDVNSLIKRADEALYASKDAGRNNGHRHTGEACLPITPGRSTAAETAKQPTAAEEVATSTLDALPNRTRFLELLRGEVRVAEDAAAPLTLLTAEMQGYQELAAEFGDAIARLTFDSVGQFLTNSLREVDQLGRLEDGQFIVLMPGHTEEQAQDVGERINNALANCAVPIGDRDLRLATTIAVTGLRPEDSAVSLMRRAEEQLDGVPAGA